MYEKQYLREFWALSLGTTPTVPVTLLHKLAGSLPPRVAT